MTPNEIRDIGLTLQELARPSMSPKQLFDAVKAHHPKAKRRDITRAALSTMIASADQTPDLALQLQSLAISQRGADEDD